MVLVPKGVSVSEVERMVAADPQILADVSAGLGQPMVGISASTLDESERLEVRGW